MEEKKKNRKPLVALLLIAVIGVVGAAIAYFTSSDTFTNQFQTEGYQMQVVESFESPQNWVPGTTTNKTIVATNTGDVDAAVRIHYTESWVDSNDNPIALEDATSHERYISINWNDLATNWISSTESGTTYYYYKTKLAPNASTPTILNSVTFRDDVELPHTANCVDDATNHTRTCTTSYAAGTYTLTFYVDTVQYDSYQEAWNTSVSISNGSNQS